MIVGNQKLLYQVRGADGRLRTVLAHSLAGAKRAYLEDYKPKVGTQFSLRQRDSGQNWTHYNVI